MKNTLLLLLTVGLLGTTTLTYAERSGKQVFNSACIGCHLSGVAGAPKKGDTATWQARYGGDLTQLLAGAKRGKGAMPPKGACGTCSDAELQSAIEFMIH